MWLLSGDVGQGERADIERELARGQEKPMQNINPKVSFIVPCYNLSHFLPDCINSIIQQTYKNFEIIIMDDCSPDNTSKVAQGFEDNRVRYIRNETNLGHLRNYNKGISLANGQYIWLISADDVLRTNYILDKYVSLLETNPKIGYVFCPAIGIYNDTDIGIEKWAYHGSQDVIFEGKAFLNRLLENNCVTAAAGLARRECYGKVGLFPVDLPYAGDWYMWCAFAFHYDVGYFSEPMVSYRKHLDSMTNILSAEDMKILVSDEITVLGRIRKMAKDLHQDSIERRCVDALFNRIMRYITTFDENTKETLSFHDILKYFANFIKTSDDLQKLLSLLNAKIADSFYWKGEINRASVHYMYSLLTNVWSPETRVKYILSRLGRLGMILRHMASMPLHMTPQNE